MADAARCKPALAQCHVPSLDVEASEKRSAAEKATAELAEAEEALQKRR